MAQGKTGIQDEGAAGLFDKGLGIVASTLGVIGTILIVVMAIAVNADIISRNLFGKPIAGVNEFISLSIVATVYLQLAIATRSKRHVTNDMVTEWLKVRKPFAYHVLQVIYSLISAATFIFIIYYVVPVVLEAYEFKYYRGTAGVATVPLWPFYAAVVVGCVVSLAQYLQDVLSEASAMRGKGDVA